MGFIRALGTDFLSILLNKLFNTKISDVLYSLKAIEKKFEELETKENHFGIELDIILRSIKKKYNIFELPSREKKSFWRVKTKYNRWYLLHLSNY